VRWIEHRPITEYYVTMLQQSLSPPYRFLKDRVLEAYAEKQTLEMLVSTLFDEFKSWLTTTTSGSRVAYEISDAKFGAMIADLMERVDKRGVVTKMVMIRGIERKRTRLGTAYKIDVPHVLRDMVRLKWLSPEDIPGGLPIAPAEPGHFPG
ncbi:hypothetical protein CEUSTIGMA_g12790.t1, partial [Chlamydomonas eustigma]